MPSYADLIAELAGAKRSALPVSVWVKQPVGFGPLIYGAKYDDGSSRTLFEIDGSQYDSSIALEEAVVAAFLRCGIDVTQTPGFRTRARRGTTPEELAERQAQWTDTLNERQQALWEAMANNGTFGRAMPGSGFYQRATRDEPFGTAFADRDFGRWQGKATPPDPERVKAVERCRSLKAMADHATANPGEAANARAALDRLKTKHGIKDSEI